MVDREIKEYIKGLPPSGAINLQENTRTVISRIIGHFLFGTRVDDRICHEMIALENIGTLVIRNTGLYPICFVKLTTQRKCFAQAKVCQDLILPIIREVRKNPTTTFIQGCIENNLSDLDMARQICGIFFAGLTTTSNFTSNLLIHLVQHPTIVPELLDDVKQFGVLESKILHSCVLESARVSQPAFVSFRKVMKKDGFEINNYKIPCGTEMFLNAMDISTESEFLQDDPHIFNPKRFLEDKIPNSVLLWGGGRHMCPGRPLAILEMKYLAVNFLQALNFKPIENPFKIQFAMSGSDYFKINPTLEYTSKNEI